MRLYCVDCTSLRSSHYICEELQILIIVGGCIQLVKADELSQVYVFPFFSNYSNVNLSYFPSLIEIKVHGTVSLLFSIIYFPTVIFYILQM